MQASNGKVVSIHYTLTNEQGEILDSSSGRTPLVYLHGSKNIIDGLENEITGKKVGDKITARVEPKDGYGEYREDLIRVVGKESFEGIDEIEVGMQFQADFEDGTYVVTVEDVSGDEVTLNANHELAGVPLIFDVEVFEIRDASEEEISHGHVHGPHGHHHH